jgi:hypothetical protein
MHVGRASVEAHKRECLTRDEDCEKKSLKTTQLATPPPEAGSADTHRALKDGTKEARADKVNRTPRQRENDSIPALEALSVNPHLDDLRERETKEMQTVSPMSDHEEGPDHDPRPDSPTTHVFSRDPLTGENTITKATFYCP